jgi:hypothetical protein
MEQVLVSDWTPGTFGLTPYNESGIYSVTVRLYVKSGGNSGTLAFGLSRLQGGFTQSEAPLDTPPFSWFDAKPEFPEGGLTATCPNCHESAIYRRYHLYNQAT